MHKFLDSFKSPKLNEDELSNLNTPMTKENETKTISEEDYYAAFEKYSNATIVSFAYGASDAAR